MNPSSQAPSTSDSREVTEALLASWGQVQQLMVRMPRVIEERFGIPPHRLHVLDAVDRGAARIQEIAEGSWTSVSAASRTVDGLVRDGWLDRRPDPDDRRATHVRLTDRGAGNLAEVRGFAAGILEEIVDRLGSARAERLAGDLADFASQVSAHLEREG